MSDNFDQKLTEKLAQSAFWSRVGFRVESSSEGKVRVCLPYDKGNTTAATALHGGAIAATLDAAGCLAAWSSETRPGVSGRTLSCDVSYIAGALGNDIYGEAEVLRRGKEIIYSAVRAVDGEGKLLASGNHIYNLADPEEIPAMPPGDQQKQAWVLGRTGPGLGSFSNVDHDLAERSAVRVAKSDGFIPYMNHINWKFVKAEFGYAEFLLPYKDHSVGDDGGLASGALLSGVDHAGSLAAWMTSELGRRDLFGSTVNTKLQTFASNINRDVIVRARAAGGSGPLVNSEVSIETVEGELVAGGSTIYRIIKRDPKPKK